MSLELIGLRLFPDVASRLESIWREYAHWLCTIHNLSSLFWRRSIWWGRFHKIQRRFSLWSAQTKRVIRNIRDTFWIKGWLEKSCFIRPGIRWLASWSILWSVVLWSSIFSYCSSSSFLRVALIGRWKSLSNVFHWWSSILSLLWDTIY